MLIVEDGTGVEDAESYLTISDAEDIILKFKPNSPFPSLTTEEKEAYLRVASFTIDTELSFIGEKVNEDQGLEWPRVYVINGVEYSDVPKVIHTVTAFLANEQESLNGIYPKLKSQSFGDSSEEYAGVYSEGSSIVKYLNYIKKEGIASSSSSIVTLWRA